MYKKVLKSLFILLIILAAVFFLYANNTKPVNKETVKFYGNLKTKLKEKGYSQNLVIISTKRFKWHNDLQIKLSGAASKSRHLTGDAIDFIVLDINKDGISDSKDVDIVFDILDKDIIGSKGGIGTYKNEKGFFSRQMIHIDCRGYRSRWAR
jgi:uncharacterized protein YcbK (DUF882 family)